MRSQVAELLSEIKELNQEILIKWLALVLMDKKSSHQESETSIKNTLGNNVDFNPLLIGKNIAWANERKFFQIFAFNVGLFYCCYRNYDIAL